MREQFRRVLQRHMAPLVMPATQEVDIFVFRNGMYPGRNRQINIIGMAFVVNRQQDFLHQILHLVGQSLQPLSEIAPQVITQGLQKCRITRTVTCTCSEK